MPSRSSVPVVAFLSTLVLLVALVLSQFELYYANVVGRSLIDSTVTECQVQLSLCERNVSMAANSARLASAAAPETRSLEKPSTSTCPSYATPVGTWVAMNNKDYRADTWVPLDPACKLKDHFSSLVRNPAGNTLSGVG